MKLHIALERTEIGEEVLPPERVGDKVTIVRNKIGTIVAVRVVGVLKTTIHDNDVDSNE